jgi:calcineurin-like phosphoesterase family protein
MSVFLTADFHLGHKNIHNFRTFVSSPEENEKLLVEAWNKTIRKNDLVFCLGDMAFDKSSLDVLGNLKGRKILLKGNHCPLTSTAEQMAVFEEIQGIIRYKKLWLTHCPIHPQEMRRCVGNAYGHLHHNHVLKRNWYGRKVIDPQYLNCCVDINYQKYNSPFITLDEVKKYFHLK